MGHARRIGGRRLHAIDDLRAVRSEARGVIVEGRRRDGARRLSFGGRHDEHVPARRTPVGCPRTLQREQPTARGPDEPLRAPGHARQGGRKAPVQLQDDQLPLPARGKVPFALSLEERLVDDDRLGLRTDRCRLSAQRRSPAHPHHAVGPSPSRPGPRRRSRRSGPRRGGARRAGPPRRRAGRRASPPHGSKTMRRQAPRETAPSTGPLAARPARTRTRRRPSAARSPSLHAHRFRVEHAAGGERVQVGSVPRRLDRPGPIGPAVTHETGASPAEDPRGLACEHLRP